MAFVKSTLVGIVSFLVATIAYVLIVTTVFFRRHPVPPGTHVAITLGWLFGDPLYWVISIGAFGGGFYWQFHRR